MALSQDYNYDDVVGTKMSACPYPHNILLQAIKFGVSDKFNAQGGTYSNNDFYSAMISELMINNKTMHALVHRI